MKPTDSPIRIDSGRPDSVNSLYKFSVTSQYEFRASPDSYKIDSYIYTLILYPMYVDQFVRKMVLYPMDRFQYLCPQKKICGQA